MAQSIIVFSHLRWDFVFQRPQHLLSRLARRYRIVYFEEPVGDAGTESYLEQLTPQPNVLVARPHTPVQTPGFHDEQLAHVDPLLKKLVRDEALHDAVLWFYTPMALPLAQGLSARAIVYDCMDELSAFLNAPRQLAQRETALLKAADVVFTGGPSLYAAKRDRHPNVHCFPSSVDAAHFAQARQREVETPLQKALPGPRLGFFGVLDERMDLAIVEGLAKAQPDWQVVMVGPVVKIPAEALPRLPNIHYFGQQTYGELPRFLAGWDVCLLPFARNAATRYISPTKTLEYMAAEKPIVSTPITDVAKPYGDIVYLGESVEEFIMGCRDALAAGGEERQQRTERMRDVLSRTSWDATAQAMTDQLEQVLARSAPKPELIERAPAPVEVAGTARALTRAPGAKTGEAPVVVIGAGPTGLSAAYHLGAGSVLLEQNSRIGGWCRSIEEGGFTFDYAGHIMFSNDQYVHRMYRLLLGDNVHWQDREAWVYSKGTFTRYPFQGALYGLPPEVIKECIVGAVEARFGPIRKQADGAAEKPASSPSACKAESITDCCGDGVLEASAGLAPNHYILPFNDRRKEPRNFEDFIYRVWGTGIAKHFAIPYNRKLWAVPLKEMETSWLGGRVPLPDLEEMIEGALKPVPKPMGPNARFGYPLRGGFQALMNGFLPHLKGQLKLNAGVASVSPSRRRVRLVDGSEYTYDALISSMPLPALIRAMGEEAPYEVRQAAEGLRHVSVRCVNLGVGRANITDKHWIYYPEDTVFHRIFVQGNASPHCNPPGGFGLTCEITYSEHKPLPCEGEHLIQRCIDDCVRVGMIRPDDPILVANQVDMPYAYVVYDHARPKNVTTIRNWLEKHDIVLAGRYSEWEYYNSDHAFIAGRKAAEAVQRLQEARRRRLA